MTKAPLAKHVGRASKLNALPPLEVLSRRDASNPAKNHHRRARRIPIPRSKRKMIRFPREKLPHCRTSNYPVVHERAANSEGSAKSTSYFNSSAKTKTGQVMI